VKAQPGEALSLCVVIGGRRGEPWCYAARIARCHGFFNRCITKRLDELGRPLPFKKSTC
jgi:hypothetical protein